MLVLYTVGKHIWRSILARRESASSHQQDDHQRRSPLSVMRSNNSPPCISSMIKVKQRSADDSVGLRVRNLTKTAARVKAWDFFWLANNRLHYSSFSTQNDFRLLRGSISWDSASVRTSWFETWLHTIGTGRCTWHDARLCKLCKGAFVMILTVGGQHCGLAPCCSPYPIVESNEVAAVRKSHRRDVRWRMHKRTDRTSTTCVSLLDIRYQIASTEVKTGRWFGIPCSLRCQRALIWLATVVLYIFFSWVNVDNTSLRLTNHPLKCRILVRAIISL